MHLPGGDGLTGEGQGFGGAGVLGDPALEVEIVCGACRGVHAHMGHHAADHQPLDVQLLQVPEQGGIAEAVGEMLLEDRLVRQRLHLGMDQHAARTRQEEGRSSG